MKLYDLCLAPVILAGVVSLSDVTTKVSKHTARTTGQGELIQVMTCDKGWGLDAKAATSGLYAIDLQYGAKLELGKFSLNLIPKGGISYTDHTVRELPQTVQFSVGAQFLVGYDHYRAGIELWHLSNAGFTAPNIGLNVIAITAGWSF